jgi:hypothetical protein
MLANALLRLLPRAAIAMLLATAMALPANAAEKLRVGKAVPEAF